MRPTAGLGSWVFVGLAIVVGAIAVVARYAQRPPTYLTQVPDIFWLFPLALGTVFLLLACVAAWNSNDRWRVVVWVAAIIAAGAAGMYLATSRPQNVTVTALDAETGVELWSRQLDLVWIGEAETADGELRLIGGAADTRCTTKERQLVLRSSDGDVLATTEDPALAGLPVRSGDTPPTFDTPGFVVAVTPLPQPTGLIEPGDMIGDSPAEVTVVDQASGQTLWTITIGSWRRGLAVTPSEVVTLDDRSSTLVAHDVATGRAVSTLALPEDAPYVALNRSIRAEGDIVLYESDRIVTALGKSGERMWEVDLGEPSDRPTGIVRAGDLMLIVEAGRVAYYCEGN
jgi:outer membrane protein assembly factor BamB